MKLLFVVVSAFACVGCGSVPVPLSYQHTPEEAESHCVQVAEGARSRSRWLGAAGFLSGGVAAGALGWSAHLAGEKDDEPSGSDQAKAIALPIVAGLLSSVSVYLFQRSGSASELAKSAGEKAGDAASAWKECNLAIATWDGSRSEAVAKLSEDLQKVKDELAVAKKEEEEAEEGEKKAIEGQMKAEREATVAKLAAASNTAEIYRKLAAALITDGDLQDTVKEVLMHIGDGVPGGGEVPLPKQ